MLNGRELVERVSVGCDQHPVCRAGRRGDLKVVRSARASREAGVGEQARVMTGDLEVEGDDAEGRKDRVDRGLPRRASLLVG